MTVPNSGQVRITTTPSSFAAAEPQLLVVTRRNGDQHTVLYDAADHDLISTYRWWVFRTHRAWYAQTEVHTLDGKRTTLTMHRLLMPGVRSVDHINQNGLDNRRVNLRPATQSQQGANMSKARGSSVYKGVSFHRGVGRWRAYITVDRTRSELGYFDDEVEAALAYDRAARAAWGGYASLNFPGVVA